MPFEFEKYINLLYERKLDEALNYRKKYTPKKLYKYVSLSSASTCNKDKKLCYQDIKLNEDKFKSLENNQIWLSKYNNLNDPFEFKGVYINKDELIAKGWPIDMLENYLERIRRIYLIGSFTTNLVDNMPMWAYYSNNHQGFCIEYDVLNAKAIYPVSYEPNRVGIASILTSLIDLSHKIAKGQINESDKNFQFYMTLITHFATMKHKSWSNENEYRVLYANYNENNLGECISSIKIGLQANRIFIGSRCSEENKKRISEISKHIGINAYEMYYDDKKYKLRYRLIK